MSQQCGFAGNADLYGLGTRLGAYLLWFSTQIAYYFQLDSAGDLSESWTIFSLALTIAIFILTFQSQDADADSGGDDQRAHPADVVIMLFMLVGGMSSSSGISGKKASRAMRPLWWRLLLLNLAQVMVLAYSSWFWIAEISGGSEHFQHADCGTVIFFFSRVQLESSRGVGVFFAVLSTFGAVGWASGFLAYYEDLLAFVKGSFIPLSRAANEELLDYLNTHCRDSLVFLASAHDVVSQQQQQQQPLDDDSTSVCLKNITYTHLVVEVGTTQHRTRSVIRLDRPLTDMRDKKRVQERIESMANFQKDLRPTYDQAKVKEEEEEINMKAFTNVILFVMKDPFSKLQNLDDKNFNRFKMGVIVWSLLCAVYTVLAIELTIAWNGITDVYSIQTTGQLIPFIIGAIGLCKALHDVHFEIERRRLEEDEEREGLSKREVELQNVSKKESTAVRIESVHP